jgi:hypothetical protein
MKAYLLEIRPIYTRKTSRTVGHVFAAMLALKLCREIEACLERAVGTADQDDDALTIEDALLSLSRQRFQRRETADGVLLTLPRPDAKLEAIVKALDVRPLGTQSRNPSACRQADSA